MELSVVVPLYNEEENVVELLTQLHYALEDYQYEIILVDDGSTDQTVSLIIAQADKRVRLVTLGHNQGQTIALKTGIGLSQGQYIVTIDGDLQNDPADIPSLVKHLKTGPYDMVAGYRQDRQDPWHRTIPSQLANALIRTSTGVRLRDYGCTLKIFRASLAKSLDLHGELHRFIPVLAHLQGARITEIPVHHRPRIHGRSNYGLNRTLKVVSDLLLILFFQKYWAKAMHLFGTAGILWVTVGISVLTYLVGVKLLGHDIGGRPLLLFGTISVLGGLQLISFGLIAEMLYRLHHRPEPINSQVVSFSGSNPTSELSGNASPLPPISSSPCAP
ncbi:MAG: glycosyltransferase family 2 protein [Cyclobacteriaceae bacterium]